MAHIFKMARYGSNLVHKTMAIMRNSNKMHTINDFSTLDGLKTENYAIKRKNFFITFLKLANDTHTHKSAICIDIFSSCRTKYINEGGGKGVYERNKHMVPLSISVNFITVAL